MCLLSDWILRIISFEPRGMTRSMQFSNCRRSLTPSLVLIWKKQIYIQGLNTSLNANCVNPKQYGIWATKVNKNHVLKRFVNKTGVGFKKTVTYELIIKLAEDGRISSKAFLRGASPPSNFPSFTCASDLQFKFTPMQCIKQKKMKELPEQQHAGSPQVHV